MLARAKGGGGLGRDLWLRWAERDGIARDLPWEGRAGVTGGRDEAGAGASGLEGGEGSEGEGKK